MSAPKQSDVASSLAVGDKVEIRRNLDHPAHMVMVEGEYGTEWRRDPSVVEVFTVATVSERLENCWGSNGSYSKEPRVEVKVGGFWYGEDGHQVGSGALYIVKVS